MRKFLYILPLLLTLLFISPKSAFAADWNWDTNASQLKNHGLTSFTLTYDNKNDLSNGGSIDFCQSSTGVNSDGYGFVFAGQDAYIIDYANGLAYIYNGLSHIQSGSNTISIDCVTGHFVVNGITIITNAVSTAGTYNDISLTDGTVTDNGNVFDPSYTGNYYVSSPVVVGNPPPSPTPSPTPASGSTLFQDSFTDTDGTTLQQHNSQWVNVQGNGVSDMVIQSNRATFPSGPISAYFLNGFSSQGGNQCISGKMTVNTLNDSENVGLALDVSQDHNRGYQIYINKNSNDTLTWTLDDVNGNQLSIRKITTQSYDWTQEHTLRLCDLNNVLFVIMDDETLYTTSDLNLNTSGFPAIGLTPDSTLDDFVYSTGIPSQTTNHAPILGTVTVTPSPTHINTSTSASAPFTDADTTDTHTAIIDWGDGTGSQSATVTESSGSGTVSGSHTYTAFGNYTVTVTVKDNSNATDTKTAPITVVKQLTTLDPATVYVSKGLLNLLNKFDLKAEVYKDSTLVSNGEIDNVNPGTGATAETIPFHSFSPIDFPAGSALKIKLYACSATGLTTGTATLHYNASTVDSKFGATIGLTDTTYHLLSGSVLGTSAGSSAQTIAAKSRCSSFTSFGTWSVTP